MKHLLAGLLLSTGLTLSLCLNSAQAQPETFTSLLRDRVQVGPTAQTWTLAERMAEHNVPGVAIAILEDGEIVYVQGFGTRRAGQSLPVDGDTVFSAGSVSKVATASLALAMAENGQLDLDLPVSRYLESWSLPDQAAYDENTVTLRTILSHTAGFNTHGFRDFQPGESLPSTLDTLNGTGAAGNDALSLLFAPGTQYKYSGGGYTLAQLVLADIAGEPFADLADEVLFSPLGMDRSTFAQPLPDDYGNIAYAHGRDGQPAAGARGYESFPETAASGLWVSAHDLARLTRTLIHAYQGRDDFLSQDLAIDMMTPVAPSEHGLGPRLDGSGESFFFHHGGANNSYKAWMEGHLATGDGLVVLTNGSNGDDIYVEIRNAVADAMGWSINARVEVPQITVPADILAGYEGRYRVSDTFPLEHRRNMVRWIFESDLNLIVQDEELRIYTSSPDESSPLIPVAPHRFLIPAFMPREGVAELELHRNADGTAHAMTFHITGRQSFYQRVEAE